MYSWADLIQSEITDQEKKLQGGNDSALLEEKKRNPFEISELGRGDIPDRQLKGQQETTVWKLHATAKSCKNRMAFFLFFLKTARSQADQRNWSKNYEQ